MFYSHPDGYKLQLSAEVICHCSNCRKPQQKATTAIQSRRQQTWPDIEWQGTDMDDFYVGPSYYPGTVTSFAINLYIFKGDHDSQLKWPFKEKVTITMYQEIDHYYDHSRYASDMRYNGEYPAYIPHTVAIFEGNQNYTSTGGKLDIKPVIEKDKADSMQLPQMASQQSIFDDEQMYMKKIQSKSHALLEKGVLLPARLQNRTECFSWEDVYNKTVYFEVTFSP